MFKKFNMFALVLLILGQTVLGPIGATAQEVPEELTEEEKTALEYAIILDEAEDAVEQAEQTEHQHKINEALDLVAGLEEGGEKERLYERLEILLGSIVETVEGNKDPEAIEAITVLLGNLENLGEIDVHSLLERLEAIEGHAEELETEADDDPSVNGSGDSESNDPNDPEEVEEVNGALQAATEAVKLAEKTKEETDIQNARELVEALLDSEEKETLKDRLTTIIEDEEEANPITVFQEVIEAVVALKELVESLESTVQLLGNAEGQIIEVDEQTKAKLKQAQISLENLETLVEALDEEEDVTEGEEVGKLELQAQVDDLEVRLAEISLFMDGLPNEEKIGFNLEIGKVTDLAGNLYTDDNPLGIEDEFKLKIDWILDDGHNYEAGDEISFALPKEITFAAVPNPVELKDQTGNVVATYTIDGGKNVHLKFTDYVTENSDVEGWIELIAKLDKGVAEEEDGKVIISPIEDGKKIEIPINMEERKKTIEKKGEPNRKYNGNEITWTVTVNKDREILKNANVIDKLPKGTVYKEGSLKVTKQKTSLSGTVLGSEDVSIIPSLNGENNEITVNLGDIDDQYVIEYVTTITDEDAIEFKNEATLIDDDLEDKTGHSTITIERGKPIKKAAVEGYNPKTGIVKWAIEFNYNLKKLEAVDLEDTWQSSIPVAFLKETLQFQEMAIDDEGNALPTGDPIDLPEGATVDEAVENGFAITNITTDKAYRITYETKVTERVLEEFMIKNTAGFGPESSTGEVGTTIGQYYGSKSAGNIDYQAKTVDWTIEINHDEYLMKKISLEDTLGPGLNLKADTISITVDGDQYAGGYEVVENGSVFEVIFPEDFETDKKIIITYQTDYVADKLIEEGESLKATNGVEITWTPEGSDDSITRGVSAETELNEHTSDSSWKSGSYNPATKEITWTIYTNYRENAYENLIIKDIPQQNQKLVTDSITIKELEIATGGEITEGPVLELLPVIDGNSFSVTIGETSKAYKIEYKTSLKELGEIKQEYTNKAEVLNGEGTDPISKIDASVSIYDEQKYGDKSGVQDGKQVHWSIDVNIAQQQITNLTVVDTISDNQEYLRDTIKVYEVTYDESGNRIKGSEFENFDIVVADNEFTITWKEQVEHAFIIEYSTLFFAGHGDPVSNGYKITGSTVQEGEDAGGGAGFEIKQLTSGGAQGKAGYLIVNKKDVTYGELESPLEGVRFDLIDADSANQNVLKTGVTNSDGEIDFGRLLFGDYILREYQPEGYIAPKQEQRITIDKEHSIDVNVSEYTFDVENYKPVYIIELTKKNDLDEILVDVEFKVYDQEIGGNEVGEGSTDENGKVEIKLNPAKAGTYYVEEVTAPAHHKPVVKRVAVTIGDTEKVPVKTTIENELYPGIGKLKKIDVETQKVLSGATFKVYKDGTEVGAEVGKEVGTMTEDTGVYVTPELQPGTYIVKETSAPIGYGKSRECYELIIPKANEVKAYEIGEGLTEAKTYDPAQTPAITNAVKTTSIQLQKTDSINGKKLVGAQFEIEKVSGEYDLPSPTTGTKDSNGMLIFEKMKPGVYKITETAAPEGYIQLTESIEVTITHEDVHNKVVKKLQEEVTNDPLVHVILQKKDSDTGYQNLAGAKFDVVDLNGESITGFTDLTTNAQGQINITGLPAGTYQLKETKAPTGYKIKGDGLTESFTVDGNVEETKDVPRDVGNDIIKGSVELTKIDGDSNDKLEGVEFTLDNISFVNGDVAFTSQTKATDANGHVKFDDLRPGRYTITETKKFNDEYQDYWGELVFNIVKQDEKHEFVIADVKNYKLVEVNVKKEWNDGNNEAEKRPDEVTIDLFRNNELTVPHKTATVKASDGWTYTFTGLDAVDSSGKKYTYTVQERAVEGYKQESLTGNMTDGFNITNVPFTSIEVEKVWEDDGAENQPAVTIDLLQDGTGLKEQTVNASSEWKTRFEDLPVYNPVNGQKYMYTVEERAVDGYTQKRNEATATGFKITNVRTGKENMKVKKTWLDEEGTAERPASITVKLFQKLHDVENYPTTANQTITIESTNDWEHVFKDLPLYDENGKAYEYKVEEVAVPGYKTRVDGFDITNTRTGKTKIDVEKVWQDDQNKDEDRPGAIEVELVQVDSNSQKISVGLISLDEDNNWQHIFKDLEKYDDKGIPFTFEVREKDVNTENYEAVVKETSSGNFVITNTRIGTVEVEGTKIWQDDKTTDRPDEITILLLQNGIKFKEKVIGKDDSLTYSFTELPKYDNQGVAYKYAIDEVDVEGYTKKIDGYNITNTRSEKMSIDVTKQWLDTPDTTSRPDSITIELFQGEKVFDTKVVKPDSDGNWKHTFDGLEKYDSEGKEYSYSVKEQHVPGYNTNVNGFEITNTREGEVNIAGTKTWKDNENVDNDRPEKITVQLLQNGAKINEMEVAETDNWVYDFGTLPEFDESGAAYNYTVEEVMSAEDATKYKVDIDEYMITNTRIGETEVKGTKTWQDGNATNRPDIEILLFQNEVEIEKRTVTEADQWAYSFTGLAQYDDNGVPYNYTIGEVDVDGYKKKIDGYNITNTRTGTMDIEIDKIWKDDSNATGKRPFEVTVELFRNDNDEKAIDTKVIRASEDWKNTFTGLAQYDDEGELYTYTVKELPVDGYESVGEVTGTEAKVTNRRAGKVSVDVKKQWKDNGNATQERPETIKVELLKNGDEKNPVQTVEITPTTNWAYTFTDLEQFDSEGVEIAYSVKEQAINGYQLEMIEGNMADGFIITNVQTTEVKVEKVWKDEDASDRPEEVKVELYQNGKHLAAEDVTLTADDWTHTFTDLLKYDSEGNAYAYTVQEVDLDSGDYKLEGITGDAEKGFKITNVRIGKTSINIKKLWKDDENATENRPDEIKVNVLQNGNFYKEFTLSEENNWALTVENLPKYDENGKAYSSTAYTVKEQEVAGYASEIDGYNITNIRTDKKDIEITKTWLDDESEERPKEIEVALYRSIIGAAKELVSTYKLEVDTGWSYKVKDLPVFDLEGKAYLYEIEEVAVDGYVTAINGFDITNTRTGVTSVEGIKIWKGDRPSNRPASITVNLLQNGEEFKQAKVTKDTLVGENEWHFIFENLPKYDEQGVAYEYTITEERVTRYTTTIDGYKITNKRSPGGGGWVPPTDPDPEEPVDPEDPTDPDPEEPVDPEDPTDPNPEEPVDPEDPVDPDPENPLDPEEPTDPVDPEEPADPDSKGPEEPTGGDSEVPGGNKTDPNGDSQEPGSNEGKLPQTGEEYLLYMMGVGVLFIIGGGAVLLMQRRGRKQ